MLSRARAGLVAGVLVALQGLALVVIGAALGVRAVGGQPSDRLGAELGAALAVGTGLAVGWLARSVLRRRPWVRSPVIVLELLCLPVAWGLFQAHEVLIGTLVAGAAVLAIALVAAGDVGRAPVRERPTRR